MEKYEKAWRSGAATDFNAKAQRYRGAKGAASHRIVSVSLFSHDRGEFYRTPLTFSSLRPCVFAPLRFAVGFPCVTEKIVAACVDVSRE
jgi:hypothetical protein